MKKILMSAAAMASVSGTALACGSIDVGEPNWSTAQIVAAVDSFILSNGMGCDVSLVPAPTKQVIPLMMSATKPLLVGEFWANGVDPVQLGELEDDGVVDITGLPFPEAGEFWYVSKAFAEAYPELDTVEEVRERADLFDGKFYGCPVGIGWGCEWGNRRLAEGWGMQEAGWTIENPGSSEGQAAIVIDAYNTDSFWVGYYWTPTAVAIANELVALKFERDFVGQDVWGECYVNAEPPASCGEYVEGSYSPATVVTIASGSLADEPQVQAFAETRMMSMAALGAADAQMAGGMTASEVAAWYLSNYDDEWSAWVSEDVADAVRSAL